MGCSVDQATSECGCEQVAKRVTLLQHARDEATSGFRAVFESSGRSVPIEPTHGDSKQRTAGEELFVGLAEARAELNNDEEYIVRDKGPFTAIPIGSDASTTKLVIAIAIATFILPGQRLPNMTLPTERNISTSVIPHVI